MKVAVDHEPNARPRLEKLLEVILYVGRGSPFALRDQVDVDQTVIKTRLVPSAVLQPCDVVKPFSMDEVNAIRAHLRARVPGRGDFGGSSADLGYVKVSLRPATAPE